MRLKAQMSPLNGRSGGLGYDSVFPIGKIVSMLRGEIGYSGELEDVAEVSRMYYQDGMDGRPCEFPALPPELSIEADIAEMMNNFLHRCWEQGRQDARRAAVC